MQNLTQSLRNLTAILVVSAHATAFSASADSSSATLEGTDVVLSQNGTQLTCDWSLSGSITTTSTQVTLSLTSGSFTGSLFSGCNMIAADFNPPWELTVTNSQLDAAGITSYTSTGSVNGALENVKLSTPIGDCEGDVPADYSNGGSGASCLDFQNSSIGTSGCTLTGTLCANPDFNVKTP